VTTPGQAGGSDDDRLNDPKAVDAAFDAIVANIDQSSTGASADPWPEAEDDDPAGPPELEDPPPSRPRTPRADWSGWEDIRPLLQPSHEGEPVDEGGPVDADDDEHYVPPPPPPVPRGDRVVRWAWAGAVGAPVTALLLPLIGWQLDGLVGLLLVAAFLGGFITLVSRLRPGPRIDDGPDDGAVV
jgi:hypothetical protein